MNRVQLGAIALRIVTLLVMQYRKITEGEVIGLLEEMGVYTDDIHPFIARLRGGSIYRFERRCQELALQLVIRIIEIEWYEYSLFQWAAWMTAPGQHDLFIEALPHFVGKGKHARETMLEL